MPRAWADQHWTPLDFVKSAVFSPAQSCLFRWKVPGTNIQLPRQEDQRMRSHVQALPPLGQWASRRGLVPGSPVSAGRLLGDRSGWWAHSFMFDFWQEWRSEGRKGRGWRVGGRSPVTEKIKSSLPMFMCSSGTQRSHLENGTTSNLPSWRESTESDTK